jgi:hypothetical protein
MNLSELMNFVINKRNFSRLEEYLTFCDYYLEYIAKNLQAIIVSQNENNYIFFQYDKKGNFQITRPINLNLFYSFDNWLTTKVRFKDIIRFIRNIQGNDTESQEIIRNSIYTIQQSIGACLDALPEGKSNTARKINGDLFENLIRIIIREIGLNVRAGVVQIPINIDNEFAFNMSYQHDLIIEQNDEIRIIGSVKTSSKDRIDKIFIDKFLYNKLTETQIPHIAIFLNDVQRKKSKKENEYGINSTFLPGHFKGYTVKLNPLDGVYYCDLRPIMKNDDILKQQINTIDVLLCQDIWNLIK